jgi:pectate lyase
VIDSKPITKGEQAKLYVEGNVFKKMAKDNLEIVGTVGGLRLVLSVAKATPNQSNTFSSDKFYLAII